MRIEAVPEDALEELIEDLSDLRHDLGKYITFEVRFLGPDPETEALRSALRADILQTDKRGGEVSTAWQVWARLRPVLLEGDEDVARIEAGLSALQAIDLDGPREGLEQAAALAGDIAHAARSLHRRACALDLE